MDCKSLGVVAATYVGCCLLVGCQPWRQLNENAVGQSSSVASLLERSAVRNLVLFHVNQNAIPSQINVSAGSVSTTDQASVGANDPLNRGLTTTIAATTQITTSLASNSLSPSLSNQQNQSWTLATVTSPDILVRLAALYRYVTVPGADLCHEYPEVMIARTEPRRNPIEQRATNRQPGAPR